MACTACPITSFHYSAECSICPKNTYDAKAGSSFLKHNEGCTDCAQGKYSVGPGASECLDCVDTAGKWNAECSECPPSTYGEQYPLPVFLYQYLVVRLMFLWCLCRASVTSHVLCAADASPGGTFLGKVLAHFDNETHAEYCIVLVGLHSMCPG